MMRSLAISLTLLILFSCSQAPEPRPDLAAVHIVTGYDTTGSRITKAGGSITDGYVDSLHITRVKFMLGNIRLSGKKQDSSLTTVLLRQDPIVYIIDTSIRILNSANVEYGLYNRLTLDFYKFTDSAALFYKDDMRYRDFYRDGTMNTVLIEGKRFIFGAEQEFTYLSDPKGALSFDLEPPLSVSAELKGSITLRFDPAKVFLTEQGVLDPSYAENSFRIAQAVLNAFRTQVTHPVR